MFAKIVKVKFALLAILILLLSLAGCAPEPEPKTCPQARNLQKLCRVWGFATYTHQSFLLGEICWDEELLNLIPIVMYANENEVNDILYEWFLGLGDDGYDLDWEAYRQALLEHYLEIYELRNIWLIEYGGLGFDDVLQAQLQETVASIDFVLEYDNVYDWAAMQVFSEKLFRLSGNEMSLRPMADTIWIADESYLGSRLSAVLSRFNGIQTLDLTNAPVYFDMIGNSTFTNKSLHPNMDFGDGRYRLLGLFRLWNAMEYFFPYMDILDDCWHDLLLEFIPKMLEGTDKLSYELTLAALSSRLHDAHILFIGTSFLRDRFGGYFAPVGLAEAEGQLVVREVSNIHDSTLLMQGDVIVNLNGVDINDVVADMLKYLPFPNDEKALAYLAFRHDVLRSHSSTMEVCVLRDGEEKTLTITGYRTSFIALSHTIPSESHRLLENNIGLVNPVMLDNLADIMEEFSDTDGLIIDWRQPQCQTSSFEWAEYFVDENQRFAIMSQPFQPIPGMFVDSSWQYSGGTTRFESFLYKRNVVILMNEATQSHLETRVMSVRNGANVTVIGTNSIGANGNVTRLPLPGVITMQFTGLGVYTPEGGQTQRIGLSPDIYVNRTIAGIREGRDEFIEAAIQYLLSK